MGVVGRTENDHVLAAIKLCGSRTGRDAVRPMMEALQTKRSEAGGGDGKTGSLAGVWWQRLGGDAEDGK